MENTSPYLINSFCFFVGEFFITFDKEILSKKAFLYFEEKFINEKTNIIRYIWELPENIFLGDFSEYIKKKYAKEGVSLDNEINKIKTNTIGSVIYRFGSDEDNSLGCYVHDSKVNNGEKICSIMRKYLFEICFNIQSDIKNAQLFMNYMLASFDHNIGFHSAEWAIKMESLYKTLGENNLKKYWQNNHEKIKIYCRSISPETIIFTSNYSATYKDDLEIVIQELDKNLLKGK